MHGLMPESPCRCSCPARTDPYNVYYDLVHRSSSKATTLDLIDVNLRNHVSSLRDQFRQAQPFPHVVIDHFLDSDFCEALIREFPAFKEELALNEFGEVGQKAVFQDLPSIGPA